MINRRVVPDFKSIESFQLLSPEEIVLDNGIRVFSFNAGEQELVRIEWLFDNLTLPHKLPLLNVALSGMLLEGTTRLTGAEIAEKVDFYGGFLQPEYSFDHSSLTLYTLNKHLDKLLPIVRAVLQDSVFPEKELQTYCRNNKQTLSVSLKKNDFVARRLFNKAIFDASKYGYSPEPEDYNQLDREDLTRLYQQQIRPANTTVFIAGKIHASTIEAIQKHFGAEAWPNQAVDGPEIEPSFLFNEPATGSVYVEKEDALQSAIRMGSRTINRDHPDFSYLLILNTLLGGYFGSRLMSNIREDKGYTYGIGSGIGTLKYAAFLTIATEVGVDVTQATLDEISKEIQRLQEELVSFEELTLVKNYLRGTFVGSLENVFSHVDKFKRLYLSNIDQSYYTKHFEIIKHCKPEDIRRMANTYLREEEMVKVVVGKL